MKGVSELIAAVLVVLIAIALVSIAYFWGLPLIQKMQGEAITERVAGYFDPSNPNSLQGKIVSVANRGGEEVFKLDVDGLWIISTTDNSIQFTFSSKATNIKAVGTWVVITPGSCETPLQPAYLGSNSFVTCARADLAGDRYNITYKVWFRELIDPTDPTQSRRQRIELQPVGPTASTTKTLRISRASVTTTPQGLTVTRVNILLG
jgi:hypothetical protein